MDHIDRRSAGDRRNDMIEGNAGDRRNEMIEGNAGDRRNEMIEGNAGDRRNAKIEESAGDRRNAKIEENAAYKGNEMIRGSASDREKESNGKCLSDRRNGTAGKNGVKAVTLSMRMRMLADMVTAGSCVADVGCDHAFLSIYLVQTGKCPKCLAMDVRKGPLSGAGEHIASYGLEEYIETRLSDGLAEYHVGEAQTLVCAGMGGRLMERILRESGEKSRSFSELILQPQSEIPEFRVFLRKAGFLITEEEAVYEDGKYYFAMKAVCKGRSLPIEGDPFRVQGRFAKQVMPTEQSVLWEPETARRAGGSAGCEIPGRQEPVENDLYDLYGKQLLLRRHPVLKQYLLRRKQTVEELITELGQKDSVKSGVRRRELSLEMEHLESALDLLQADERRGEQCR